MIRDWRAILRFAFTTLLAGALASCTTVRFVPAYDEQIDSGLTALYGDTIAFVDRMTPLAGTPAGEYASNSGFYDGADARVSALIVRAEAHRVLKDCPSAKVMNAALAATPIPAEARGEIGTLPHDDCQVVLLRLIQHGFTTMRQFHQGQGKSGIPAVARGPLIDGGVGALLRAGITVEIAKRAR